MVMPEYDSIVGLVRNILSDTRALIRDELDLMRAEVRDEIRNARAGAMAFGAAIVAGMVGLALLSVALGSGLADWLNWPVWAGYGVVSLVLLAAAYIATVIGRKRLARVKALPETRASLKENLAWMQNKSASR
jgi:MFS family permease